MIYIVLIVLLIALDLWSKKKAESTLKSGNITKFKGKINLTLHYNKGIMYSKLNRFPKLVKILNLLGIVLAGGLFIYYVFVKPKSSKAVKIALSLIIGGGIGNLYDRFKIGAVRDFIEFKCHKNIIYNIADFFIFMGTFIILISEIVQTIRTFFKN